MRSISRTTYQVSNTQGPLIMARTLIVTPTYNERDNLEALVTGVFAVLSEADILVVDDASPDGTGSWPMKWLLGSPASR